MLCETAVRDKVMNSENARALVGQGEGQRIEFKTSLKEEREAIVSLCAFAHADGGIVFFGVRDSGEIVGASLGHNTLENLANNIRANTSPPLTPSIETLEVDGHVIVAVTVQKAQRDQVIYAFGTAYIRVAKTNQVMSPEQQRVRLQRPALPSCFQHAPDAFAALIARNFLFEFAGPNSDYLELLAGDLRRLFFSLFNKHLRSGGINRMLICGYEGCGKTFNTLLLSLQLCREGYGVFYCQDIRASSLTPDHVRDLAMREDEPIIFMVDNTQNDIVKAQSLVTAISQAKSYSGKPLFLFLTRPLDEDTLLDAFGSNTPTLSMREKFIDFERLVILFFDKIGAPEAAAQFIQDVKTAALSGLLVKYRNMAFWNEVLRSLAEDASRNLTDDQILRRAHAFFHRKERHILDAREPLARLLPFLSRGVAVNREYARELLGDEADSVLAALETHGVTRIVEYDWESEDFSPTSCLVVAPALHPTKARLLAHVFRQYYGFSADPNEAVATYAERFPRNLYTILAPYYDPEDLRVLYSNPRIVALTHRYFLDRHLGKKLDRVIQRLAALDESTRDTLLDTDVIDAFALQVNGDRAYLVSKMYLFRALYRAHPKRAHDLLARTTPQMVSRTFLADETERGITSLAKCMEIFKNIYYFAATPDAKTMVQEFVRQVIDQCGPEFLRRFEIHHQFFTQLHWMLKRLHGLKLAGYFLKGITPDKLLELIRTKDTNIVELSRFVLFDGRYTFVARADGSRQSYYDILEEKLSYEDLERIFDNERSDLYDLAMNATHDFVAKALVRYADNPNFLRKAAQESSFLRDKSLDRIWTNFFLTDEERQKIAAAIVRPQGG